MSDQLARQLTTELQNFEGFDYSTPIQSIADAYNRLLAIVQALMLETDKPDGHERAWSLLKDDTFKDLDLLQEGKSSAFYSLKRKVQQVGHLLLTP